ncbi:MAG TPA: 16S rRNA (cytosine(1402)-N(4))-methyltransferase RsmH [Spirochaetota bacterium]|nr:16S rRNA (cytosine(1402)-N(4))-methyltransferase RsmH [Spirochaetota bacterium]HRR59979.1 16S rRNA (cytosine(1402)-N(4))-methyltransferase RsmH [Spirochaetota bacterium]
MEHQYYHTPVMQKEVLSFLSQIQDIESATIVDCTVGEGGHSELILKQWGGVTLYGFERDKEIFAIAHKRLQSYEKVVLINDNFRNLRIHFNGMQNSIAAFLYDFGVSSYHFDGTDRGFAFKSNQKLDMRLDSKAHVSAYDIVNSFTEKELTEIFAKYGEERWARRIAKRIIYKRSEQPIETTGQLADIVVQAIPKQYRVKNIHPATRVFQALRIYVNDELSAIGESLKDAITFLKPGGMIIALSFHSLEDRIVKDRFRRWAKGCSCDNDGLHCQCNSGPLVAVLTKKPLQPEESELEKNQRSRSAKLRVCRKL